MLFAANRYSDYLSFSAAGSSSADAALTVDAEGELTGLLNTPGSDAVSVTVASSIDTSVKDTVAITVNLAPDDYDVDLGKKTGSQLPESDEGDTFTVSGSPVNHEWASE